MSYTYPLPPQSLYSFSPNILCLISMYCQNSTLSLNFTITSSNTKFFFCGLVQCGICIIYVAENSSDFPHPVAILIQSVRWITNRCDFLYYVFISFFSSFSYMFRAFMSPSSGVFQAVVFMLPFGSCMTQMVA